MTPLDAGLLSFLLVALPLLSVAQARALTSVTLERVPAYVSTLAFLTFLGLVYGAAGARPGGPRGPALGPIPPAELLAWTVGLAGGAALLVVAFRSVAARIGVGDAPTLWLLLPRSRGERALFVPVSIAAGLGEEIAFRGYALGALAPVTGAWIAAGLTSVAFGAVHAYQGPLGVARTAALGGLLAFGALATGSLWPAVAAHALVDLAGGLWLGERLLVPGRGSGV